MKKIIFILIGVMLITASLAVFVIGKEKTFKDKLQEKIEKKLKDNFDVNANIEFDTEAENLADKEITDGMYKIKATLKNKNKAEFADSITIITTPKLLNEDS